MDLYGGLPSVGAILNTPIDDLRAVGLSGSKAASIRDLPEPPSPRASSALGDIYRPYRSAAAWYCWRAAEPVLPAA